MICRLESVRESGRQIGGEDELASTVENIPGFV